MRTVVKTYRYRCDEGAGLDDQCPSELDVQQGGTYLASGYSRPVEIAEDADWVAKGSGWHYAGSKSYCPLHAVGRR